MEMIAFFQFQRRQVNATGTLSLFDDQVPLYRRLRTIMADGNAESPSIYFRWMAYNSVSVSSEKGPKIMEPGVPSTLTKYDCSGVMGLRTAQAV